VNNRGVVLANPPTLSTVVESANVAAHPDSSAIALDSLRIGGRSITFDEFSPRTFTDRAVSIFRVQPSDSAALDSLRLDILNLQPKNAAIFRNWYLTNTHVEVMLPLISHYPHDKAVLLVDKLYPGLSKGVETIHQYLEHVMSDPANGPGMADGIFRTIPTQDRPLVEAEWVFQKAQLHTPDGNASSNTPLRFPLQVRLGDGHSNQIETFLKGFVFDERFDQMTKDPKGFIAWATSCPGCVGTMRLQFLIESQESLADYLIRQELPAETLKALLSLPGI
jgi:hypothetical protein